MKAFAGKSALSILVATVGLGVLAGWSTLVHANGGEALAENVKKNDRARWNAIQEVPRTIPTVDPAHPGNIFLEGELVSIPVPKKLQGKATRSRVLDDQLQVVQLTEIHVKQDSQEPDAPDAPVLRIGCLPIGWYRVEFLDDDEKLLDFTTAAVLAKLAAPVPQDSPLCLDVGVSGLNPDKNDPLNLNREKAALQVNLTRLLGVNWIRDRIHWREMQPGPDQFAGQTRYDMMAASQTAQGLKVLQVFHSIPDWSRDKRNRSRADLRHLYNFCKAMAQRFKGTVHAWEPWNEGNACNFGAFSIDELCSWQKAAYLGFKAGDPDLPICWNPFGGTTTKHFADGVLQNETWPYYDIYCIHSYDWPHAFENLWTQARRAASGRPIWVTEADRGMTADPESKPGDYTHADAIKKAQLIPQEHVRSFFAGAVRHFHFILCNYMEGKCRTQFGLLRLDSTPRPSYVAMAAVGRFLAGAKCLGRYEIDKQPNSHIYAFRAKPDGQDRDVLVAWNEKEVEWPGRGKQAVDWTLPSDLQVEAAYDYLGRSIGTTVPAKLTSASVYLVLPAGEASSKLPLRAVSVGERRTTPEPSPVVLQLQTPNTPFTVRKSRSNPWTDEQARVFKPGEAVKCVVVATNLSDNPIEGTLRLEIPPKEWDFSKKSWSVKLAPMSQVALEIEVTRPEADPDSEPWITIRGDFGPAGKPVLSFEASKKP